MPAPLVVARGRTLPEAWERSLVGLAEAGERIFTEYGEWSVDAPAVIVVEEPFSEPRVHLKGVVAGSLKGLEEYAAEVADGVHDGRVGEYGYTYHERLFAYRLPGGGVVDQVAQALAKLAEAPHSRRAQAVTWQPWRDPQSEHPPCLQRLWFRVVGGRLHMHAHMRSNDALKAAFMNIYAFTELQRRLAERLGVGAGRYLHFADSYHVYERDLKWFQKFVGQIRSGESRRYWRATEEYRRMAGLEKT
jgi:thymidylate synthase